MSGSSPKASSDRIAQPLWLVTVDSIHVLDLQAKTLCRVTGIRPPTAREGRDGTPRTYEELLADYPLTRPKPVLVPEPGCSVIVSWGGGDLYTRTSEIIAVSATPAWGGCFRVAGPQGPEEAGGTVVSAGQPTLTSKTLSGAFVAAALLTIGASAAPSATAVGTALAGDPRGSRRWTSVEVDAVLAPVGDDGWRRPWALAQADRT